MSSAIKIKGSTIVSHSNTTTTTTQVAQVHTPATNVEARRTMNGSECIQRVRSISNGRTPEGLKLNKYSGKFTQGERTVVPLAQSKFWFCD